MEKGRVFLTDWQVLFSEGVYLTLCGEAGYAVIGDTTTSEKAIDFFERHRPAVAILDADHGELTRAEIIYRIKQNVPSVAVILMMDSYEDEQVFAVLKSGAHACLNKDVKPDDLLNTVRRVVRGEYPISQSILKPAIASRIINEFEHYAELNDKVDNLPTRLSVLEAQILKVISNGTQLEEIALNLNITEDTIRQRLYTILGKLVANDRMFFGQTIRHHPPLLS